MIIAIDGESGSGKTSLAQEIARKLGFYFIATGNIYRAVTAYMIQREKDHGEDENEIISDLKNSNIAFDNIDRSVRIGDIQYKDLDLMTEEISRRISSIAQLESVREIINKVIREFAKDKDIVVEGRDMTSVVFPEAEIKFYITADIENRAERRYKALKQSGKLSADDTLASIKQGLIDRHKQDTGRKIAPLVRVADAYYIANDSTFENTIETMISIIHNHPKYKGSISKHTT